MMCYLITFIFLLIGIISVLLGVYLIISCKDLVARFLATLLFLLAVAYTLQVLNSGQNMVDECLAKNNKNCCGCE